MSLLDGVFWLITVLWVGIFFYNLICIKMAPSVPRTRTIEFENSALRFAPGNAPFVSILVPARNEAHRVLAESVRSMLSQDYPAFEVIAVDDRSTDQTLEILDGIANEDSRLKVIKGEALPEGWIGKPWALQQAKTASQAEWLLATDADVIFKHDALSQAMSIALREGCDGLSLIPALSSQGFWMKVAMPMAGWSIAVLFPYWRVNNPRSKVALGAGGFFLLRSAAHDLAGGYAAIRNEVIDDAASARLLKESGFRFKIAAGDSLLSTPMYSGIGEFFEGFGKNAFVGSGSSVGKSLLLSASNLCFTVFPAITLVYLLLGSIVAGTVQHRSILIASTAAYLAMVLAFIPVYRRAKEPVWCSFLALIGHLFLIVILLSSMVRILTGKGVTWKSRTLYSRNDKQAAGR